MFSNQDKASENRNPVLGNGRSRPFKSLQYKLLMFVVLGSTLFTLISTAIQINAEYHQDMQKLDQRIASIQATFMPSLALSIWTLDTHLIETQLNSLLNLPDIHALELITSYGETFQLSNPHSSGKLKTYEFQLIHTDEDLTELGTLVIQSDIGILEKNLGQLILLVLGTETVEKLLLALLMLFIIQRLVTRHLSHITAYIDGMRIDRLDKPLTLARHKALYRDELDTIVITLNRMRETFRKDIDLLEEIQNSLQKSEETYRLAMQATQDGLWDWDIEENDVYYSPSWSNILQLKNVPSGFDTWHDRLHPDDTEKVMQSLQDHLDGKSDIWQQEHRLKRGDGKWLWVLGRGQVVKRDNHNRPLRMIGTMSDIHLKKENEELIWHQANYDSLTNLPNRKFLTEMLEQEVRRAKRFNAQIWLLFVDLDGFKEVNDTLGHPAGDQLLREVAQRLLKTIRNADTAGRLGGDEFAIILSEVADIAQIDYFASRLIRAIEKPCQLPAGEARVTASIGIANYPHDTRDAHDLLKFADQAMYVSKNEGKNRFTYFTPALQSASLLRQQISRDIQQAIQENQFELYFQPILETHSHNLIKAEALIRWNHPEKGLIGPAAFIPLAEETGMIHDIGNWVFQRAAHQLKDWQERCQCHSIKLSVNLSPAQLQNKEDDFSQWLELLKTLGLQGSDIILEITENMLLKNESLISKRLRTFRQAGIQFAIDDFGTGYSSLSYLNELDVDYLKIDQSFVRNLSEKSSEETLVQAIIVMAHRLGLQVIAEGVETEHQSSLLKNMGCDYLQGYLFARPLPASDFEARYLLPDSHPNA